MSEPTQTCAECGRSVTVTPDGRGFPPDIAKRKLKRLCVAADCLSRPVYRAGLHIGGPITGQAAPPAPRAVRCQGSDE